MARRSTVMAVRRTWILASLSLAVVMGFGAHRWYRARTGGLASVISVQPLYRSAVTVVPGIYLLGGLSPAAAYVLETSDGLILVDAGIDADAGPLKAEMSKLGLDWRRVRAILLTHAHGDHTGGAEALRAQTGARVYAGAGDAAVLRAGGPREAFFSIFDQPAHGLHPTTVDVELHGDETISVGEVRVQAIAAPGHTPGSICYLAECRGFRAFFAGDVILVLRGDDSPRPEPGKPLGTYSAYLPPCYRGDAGDSLATLHRLRHLPVPDLILPGHPRAQWLPRDPRMSQRQWESMLDVGIRDMETLLARYEADGADFLDGHPKALLPDLYYLGDRGGSAVYGFFAGPGFVLVDAPGGPGLAEFVREGLRRLGREPQPPAAVLLTASGAEETSGIGELLAEGHPRVIAASAGIPRLRESVPPGTEIQPAEELPGQGWLPVSTVAVAGRGLAPIAYRLRWNGKTVLFSGRIPVKISQEAEQGLIADLTHPPGDVGAYVATITRLRESRGPDLWLPAVPTHGQNANLYDDQWSREIEENVRIVRAIGPNPSRP
jgi:glyoxylase-like metal-dependent hydrolase (beta-lactamase superfamily II)